MLPGVMLPPAQRATQILLLPVRPVPNSRDKSEFSANEAVVPCEGAASVNGNGASTNLVRSAAAKVNVPLSVKVELDGFWSNT